MATDAAGRKLVFWQFQTWARRQDSLPADVLPLIVAEPGDPILDGMKWTVTFDAFLRDCDLMAIASCDRGHSLGHGDLVYACVRRRRGRPITSIRCLREGDAAVISAAINGRVVPPAEPAAA